MWYGNPPLFPPTALAAGGIVGTAHAAPVAGGGCSDGRDLEVHYVVAVAVHGEIGIM